MYINDFDVNNFSIFNKYTCNIRKLYKKNLLLFTIQFCKFMQIKINTHNIKISFSYYFKYINK